MIFTYAGGSFDTAAVCVLTEAIVRGGNESPDRPFIQLVGGSTILFQHMPPGEWIRLTEAIHAEQRHWCWPHGLVPKHSSQLEFVYKTTTQAIPSVRIWMLAPFVGSYHLSSDDSITLLKWAALLRYCLMCNRNQRLFESPQAPHCRTCSHPPGSYRTVNRRVLGPWSWLEQTLQQGVE